jgi:VanZ family protein
MKKSHIAVNSQSDGASGRSLALWVAMVCIGVILYASLQPFEGWIAPEPGTPFFLWQSGQRWIASDLAFNVVAYVPLGAAVMVALPHSAGRRKKVALTLGLTAALSMAVETAQMWLPMRHASMFDFFANAFGGVVGAVLGLVLVGFKRLTDFATQLRDATIVTGPSGDLKLVLLCLWLLAQINPAIPLFGATFQPGQVDAFDPAVVIVELAQTAAALIGIGLFTDLTMRKRWMGGVALVLVIAAAIALKIAAAQTVLKPLAWDEWLRPGRTLGLAAGAFALMILFWLPRSVKSVLAGIALVSGLVINGLLPDMIATKAPLFIFSWNYGHLLHLNGLTRTIVLVWPIVATAVLFWRFVLPPKRPVLRASAQTLTTDKIKPT